MSTSTVTTKTPKKLGLWMRQIARWIMERIKKVVPYAILGAASWVVISFGSGFSDCKEVEIRWLGLVFETIGFVVVVWQLIGRQRLFGKPSFWSTILKGVPSRHARRISLSAHASAGAPTVSARLSLRPGPSSSMERRIEILEQGIEELKTDMRELKKSVRRDKEEHRSSLEEVRHELRTSSERLDKLLDEAVAGGIHLEWVGVVYFIAGVVLATAAPEISFWSGHPGQCSG